jgi:hypothetical protein
MEWPEIETKKWEAAAICPLVKSTKEFTRKYQFGGNFKR